MCVIFIVTNRLVTEDDKVCIYQNLENARVYHGTQVEPLEITAEVLHAAFYIGPKYL